MKLCFVSLVLLVCPPGVDAALVLVSGLLLVEAVVVSVWDRRTNTLYFISLRLIPFSSTSCSDVVRLTVLFVSPSLGCTRVCGQTCFSCRGCGFTFS